jgi:hypothetical protein
MGLLGMNSGFYQVLLTGALGSDSALESEIDFEQGSHTLAGH